MHKLSLKKHLIALSTFIWICLFAKQAFSSALRVTLSLKERGNVDRLSEPVTCGLPLPEGVIFADKKSKRLPLKLVNSTGRTIPAHFTATAPWPDGSVRWVLIDFQAGLAAEARQDYYLEQIDKPQAAPASSLIVRDEKEKIIIDTGVIKFTVSKTNFNLLDRVLIKNPAGGVQEIISPGHEEGIILRDDKNRAYLSALGAPSEIKIEESNPFRVVILIRGQYHSSGKRIFYPQAANYTVRLAAYNNKDYIRCFFTLENNGRYGFNHEDNISDNFLINDLSLTLPLKLEPSSRLTSHDYSGSFNSADRFFIFQRHTLFNKYDEKQNFQYFIKHNDKQVASGQRTEGWLDLKGEDKGFAVFMRHFWQNYPKSIEIDASKLSLNLWPEGGTWPPDAPKSYKIRGGTHKTYEILLRFYNPQTSDNLSGKQLSAAFNFPLSLLPSPDWFVRTNALGWIAPTGLKSEDKKLREALQRYEKLQGCKVHIEDAEIQHDEIPASTVYTEREQRGEGFDWYGWMDFGDLPWGGETGAGAYCSGHYDWPYGMLLQFVRSGDYAFFDLGDEITRHRMDIDQYHSKNGSPWLANFQWNEFGTHERQAEPWEPNPSHTWIKGLVLYHLLTGNPKSKEVALAVGRATEYYWTHDWGDDGRPGSAELRIQGWSIENLIQLYKLTGNKKYLNLATTIYRERTAPFINPEGYTGNPREVNIYQLVLVLEPMIELNLLIDDENLRDDFLRILEFLTKRAYSGGKTQMVKERLLYQQYYLPYNMNVHSGLKAASAPGYNFMVSNALAYAYRITGNPKFNKWSRHLFKDAVFYWQEDTGYIDPDKRSPISYAAAHFPGSRTKIHGWINRYPQIFLHLLNQPKQDTAPPAAIKDLEAIVRFGDVILDWTAPGDDGRKGKATKYQIKYADQSISSELAWLAAKNVMEEPVPQKYTTIQKHTIPGLKTGKTYFFAIRSFDEEGNQSPISNVVSVKLE